MERKTKSKIEYKTVDFYGIFVDIFIFHKFFILETQLLLLWIHFKIL